MIAYIIQNEQETAENSLSQEDIRKHDLYSKGKMINRDQPQADQVIGISREGFIIAIKIITIDGKK